MYEEDNYTELTNASLNYSVKADTHNSLGTRLDENSGKTAQNRNVIAFKTNYEDFDIGISRFKSGTVQLDGKDSPSPRIIQVAPLGFKLLVAQLGLCQKLMSILTSWQCKTKYSISEQIEILFGAKRDTIKNSTVTKTRGTVNLTRNSKIRGMISLAYLKPGIAMRVELLT